MRVLDEWSSFSEMPSAWGDVVRSKNVIQAQTEHESMCWERTLM